MNFSWYRTNFIAYFLDDFFTGLDFVFVEILLYDAFFFIWRVFHEMEIVDEPILDRLAQGLGFRCCSDKRERIDRDPDIASFRHYHIDDKVFHRYIQDLFDVRFQSVDLVDEQDVSGFKRI